MISATQIKQGIENTRALIRSSQDIAANLFGIVNMKIVITDNW